MKLIPTAHELIANMKAIFQVNDQKINSPNEEPLRAELFSSEQMEHFGKVLAGNHKLSTGAAHNDLINRLSDNEAILHQVRRLLTDSIKKKAQVEPAGEWLVDNFYLIEEHIRIAKKNFPKKYSESLPFLLRGTSTGEVRIYDIVLQLISHSDGRIDVDTLSAFIKAYQSVTNLQLGELWAIPLMLRLALIENLRRVSVRIAIDRVDRNLADYWSAQLINTSEKEPRNLILVVADMARSKPPMTGSFVAELIRQVQGKGPDLALSLNWLEQQLLETGLTSANLIDAEIHKQASDQVSISNSIGSLRLLGSMEWRDFVEAHSIVEQTLRGDVAGIYPQMDFATRDRYRHVVERIAKQSDKPEYEIARIAIQLTHEPRNDKDEHTSHVGYYLIGEGLAQTKKIANAHESVSQKLQQFSKNHTFFFYVFFISLITIAISVGIFNRAYSETHHTWLLALIAFLSLLSTSQLAISVVNFFSTLLVRPHLLPRMNFAHSIPPEDRTLVVIPVMLFGTKEIEDLVEALEVRFLANRNEYLHFGLLTDFTDANQETFPEDESLVNLVKQRIEELNRKYNREFNDLFYLFHRPRRWNPKQKAWMGYERKRGKLSELNSLLRGGAKDRFSLIIGDQSIFPQIKYVITLDADTQLPMGTAWKLIGTMAHPLNHPVYDEKRKRVTKGYGILQPRVGLALPDADSSFYSKMYGNEPSIDPYTRASSDVYQDLFAEGSFIGKGIYEVDTFSKVLEGRFCENGILSHDLLEGCYIRSGLISDVLLFEKYPTNYPADMKRQARWVRGDWQIFYWILPMVPTVGHWARNSISALSRWKIFDNLRRSLVPVALTLFIVLGWTVLPSSFFWTVLISLIIVLPVMITTIWDTINKPKEIIVKHHLRASVKSILDIAVKTLFALICLPYEAFSNLVAITRTLWRMLVTRKKLLEWNPLDNWNNDHGSVLSFYLSMWIEPALAVVIYIYLAVYSPVTILVAGPILLLWLVTPFVAWWSGRPSVKVTSLLSDEQNIFLRKIARKTWGYFERFVKEEDNWLPPDNFQEQPVAVIAHRTSPTNIGVSLLANLAAHDFGFITMGQLIERTTHTLSTMEKMERYRGHLYNWYDTLSLKPLFPQYISTVDSGNLAGHLMVLKQGLLAIPRQNILDRKLFQGFGDALRMLSETLDKKDIDLLKPCWKNLDDALNCEEFTYVEMEFYLELLIKNFTSVLDKLDDDPQSDTYWWKQTLNAQLMQASEDFKIFSPWGMMMTVPAKFIELSDNSNSTLFDLVRTAEGIRSKIKSYDKELSAEEASWLEALDSSLDNSIRLATERMNSINDLAIRCDSFADMEWDFLFDHASNLFSIGYNVSDHRLDSSYYDLLASEARLPVYVGIAQGKLPEESWFALGRLLTNLNGESILLSWSGSMFEYLMPLLVMPTYENTILDQTYKTAVDWQIEYGTQIGKPWGISESGYNMVSSNADYQYAPFGAPGLGLKRGLEEDTVIAPYASVMALMVAPERSYRNLRLLSSKGFEGRYGFYEAIDYTPSRLQRGHSQAIVYSFMAHHQGMSLLSLAYLLLDKPMQKRFEAEPQFKAALLLLQERIPKVTSYFAHTADISNITTGPTGMETCVVTTPDTPIPEVKLLSNGKYHVMITNSGAGYSRWKDIALTRWREDSTCDNWGVFCYIRDVKSNTFWSNTHQPALKKAEKYEAAFSLGRADFRSANNGIETHTEMVVSAEDDIEMRRIHLANNSGAKRTIEITSYAEVVLASPASDVMQPAFSNLFVQTEILPDKHAILCTRRPRSAEEKPPWMFHSIAVHDKGADDISYETDRMQFIGRGNTLADPLAMNIPGPLSGSQGSVLDPIVSIRYKITLQPDEKVTFDLVIGVADTKEICMSLVDKYQDRHHQERVFELAWSRSQIVLRQINASESEAQLYERLAGSVLFANSAFRADPSVLISNRKGQSGLWSYAISGDLPIVLLKMEKQDNLRMAKQLIQAHSFWRSKGLLVDLVIWNEEYEGYRHAFQSQIQALIPAELVDRPGGIFLRPFDQITTEDRVLFQTVARINISDTGGTFAEQVNRKPVRKAIVPRIKSTQLNKPVPGQIPLRNDLQFYNGIGGFSPDGSEYIIHIDSKHKTPVPWINVIANPNFASIISESGSSYTWTENAHELRLTPWHNDPVKDSAGEAYYIRDEESGYYWSATLLPSPGRSSYVSRHGFGYSVFEHIEDGIYSEMSVYVDSESAVKFNVLKIQNRSGRSRQLSTTGYIEWVLGTDRMKTAMFINSEIDSATGALFASNSYNTEFAGRVTFFDVDAPKKTYTADRTEFIGRNGTLQNPDALSRQNLSGKTGLALDPCAAIQVPFILKDGEEKEIIFRIGVGRNLNEAAGMIRKFKGSVAAHQSFEKVRNFWGQMLGALKVETPDKAINVIANGWITYQVLSSRLWGRSGFYQSGGAFGFRDQLQDILSLMTVAPQIGRRQILLSASRQFKEGDVQHWWHPPGGQGVRTHCSDDYLWLPFVTSSYILHTGDIAILDEPATFLEGRPLNPGEESYYDHPMQSNQSATLYDHCVLAIKHGFTYGEHGLPLIGTGDWNDGFDRVGHEGKGESVWLAFFLYEILNRFSNIARTHGDPSFADECKGQAQQLKVNINKNAWDGEWYKRAWMDDGTPLGSAGNEECRIDSIAQSWSVLSGAGDPDKINKAMESAYKYLVQKDTGIIQLLDPPFDKTELNPGYIKGYVPGVRENGGQYTHSAIWFIMAFAKLGNNQRVWELLSMINPVNHGNTPESIAVYKVEPYVLAADVYARAPHAGRGGWTWYTGSAGWMYRLITEYFLGFRLEANKLTIAPCIPKEWESFKIHYRYKNTTDHILVTQQENNNEITVTVDGAGQKNKTIILTDDGTEHNVQIFL